MSTDTHHDSGVHDDDRESVDIGLDGIDLDDAPDNSDNAGTETGRVAPRPTTTEQDDPAPSATGKASAKPTEAKKKAEDRMIPVGPAIATAAGGGLAAAGIAVQAASAAGPVGLAVAGGAVVLVAGAAAVARSRRKGTRSGNTRRAGSSSGHGRGLSGLGRSSRSGRSGGLGGLGSGRGSGATKGGPLAGGLGLGRKAGKTSGARSGGLGGLGLGRGRGASTGTGTGKGLGLGRGRAGLGSGRSGLGRGRAGTGRGLGLGLGSGRAGTGRGLGLGRGRAGTGRGLGLGLGRGRAGTGHGGGTGHGRGWGLGGGRRRGGSGLGLGRGGMHRRPTLAGRAANGASRAIQSPFKAISNGLAGSRKGLSPLQAARVARKRALKGHRAGMGLRGTQHPFRGWGAAGAGLSIYGCRRLYRAFTRMWNWNPWDDDNPKAAVDAGQPGRPNVGTKVSDPNSTNQNKPTAAPINTPTPSKPEQIRPTRPESNGGKMAANGVPTINQLITLSEEILRAARHRAAPGARPGMLEVIDDSAGWAIILNNIRLAAAAECTAWQRFPVHPSIPAMYSAVDYSVRCAAEAMAVIPGHIERIERENISKLRAPHPTGNQQMWNASANGQRAGKA